MIYNETKTYLDLALLTWFLSSFCFSLDGDVVFFSLSLSSFLGSTFSFSLSSFLSFSFSLASRVFGCLVDDLDLFIKFEHMFRMKPNQLNNNNTMLPSFSSVPLSLTTGWWRIWRWTAWSWATSRTWTAGRSWTGGAAIWRTEYEKQLKLRSYWKSLSLYHS